MSTLTKTRKPRQRPERKVALIQLPEAQCNVWTIRLTVGSDVDVYDVSPAIAGNKYPVWLCRKRGSDVSEKPYMVDVCNEFGNSCTCLGHTHHGHCKHVDALVALTQAGKLPVLHAE